MRILVYSFNIRSYSLFFIVYLFIYIITSYSSSFSDPLPLPGLKKLANPLNPLVYTIIIIDLLNNCGIPKFFKSYLICQILKRSCLIASNVGYFRTTTILPVIGNNTSKQLINYIHYIISFLYTKVHIGEVIIMKLLCSLPYMIFISLWIYIVVFNYYNLTFDLHFIVYLNIYIIYIYIYIYIYQ